MSSRVSYQLMFFLMKLFLSVFVCANFEKKTVSLVYYLLVASEDEIDINCEPKKKNHKNKTEKKLCNKKLENSKIELNNHLIFIKYLPVIFLLKKNFYKKLNNN